MERLNTMDSFTKGFKIERDGKIITLTESEMFEFRFFDKAVDGRNCLNSYNADEDDIETIKALKKDENKCFEIQDRISDILFNNCGDAESDVISNVIAEHKWESGYNV